MFRKRDNDPMESESEIDKGGEAGPGADDSPQPEAESKPEVEIEPEADAQPEPDIRPEPETPVPICPHRPDTLPRSRSVERTRSPDSHRDHGHRQLPGPTCPEPTQRWQAD